MEIKDVLMGTMDGKEIFRLNEINNITYVDDSINPDISIEPYYNFGKQTEFTADVSADFSADFSADLRRIIDSVSPKDYSDCQVEGLINRIQKRKHKKRRINKKWAKRYGYWDVIFKGRLRPDASIQYSEDKDVQWQGTIDNVEVVVR